MPRDAFFTKQNKEEFTDIVETSAQFTSEQMHEAQMQERLIGERGYDQEALERENTILRNRIAHPDLLEESNAELVDRVTALDMTRLVRNESILLYQDSRGYDDSPLMHNIKESIKTLDISLRKPMADGVESVRKSYQDAIDLMVEYENTKNPHFPAGKRRKRKIISLKNALIDERDRFMVAMQQRQPNEEIPNEQLIPLDVLEGKYMDGELIGGPMENLALRKREILILKKSNGDDDGPEMITVKQRFTALTDLLTGPLGEGDEFTQKKKNVTTAYNNVIDACAEYIRTHSPKTAEGKERLEAIKNLKERSEYEFKAFRDLKNPNPERATWEGAFQEISQLVDNGLNVRKNVNKFLGKKPSMRQFLNVSQSIINMCNSNPAQYTIMVDVALEEWLKHNMNDSMVDELATERFRAEDVLKKKYDELVKNPVPIEYLKNPDDDPMDENLRKSFAHLMLNTDPAYKCLSVMDNINYLTLESSKIFDVSADRIRAMSAEDQQYMRNIGDISQAALTDKYTLLNPDAVKRFMDMVDAQNVAQAKKNLNDLAGPEYLGYRKGEEKTIDSRMKGFKDDMVVTEAVNILKKAREQGMDVTDLTPRQMEELKKAGLNGISEEIHNGMMMIERALAKHGDEARAAYETHKKELYVKLAASAINTLSRVSVSGELVAEFELHRFVTETVMGLCGKDWLKESSEKMHVSGLADGANGLSKLVDKKKSDVAEWKGKEDQVKLGTSMLGGLCRDLKELSMLHGKALTIGLIGVEATTLRNLAKGIDDIMADPKQVEVMGLVADGLEGYRYKAGFARLKELKEGGFSFLDAAKKISNEYQRPDDGLDFVVVPKTALKKPTEKDKRSKEVKQIASIVSLSLKPSVIMDDMSESKAKSMAKGVAEMQKALKSFKEDEEGVREIKVGGSNVTIIHRNDGTVEFVAKDYHHISSETATYIAEQFETDMASNVSLYGKEEVLRILDIAAKDKQDKGRLRRLALQALSSTLDLPSSVFTNIISEEVINMARQALSGTATKEQIQERVNSMEDTEKINGEQTLQLLKDLEKDAAAGEKVVMPKQKPEQVEAGLWTEDETILKNLFSEMIFSEKTWETDDKSKKETPGQRLKRLISDSKVTKVLTRLIQNPTNHSIDILLEKLPIPEGDTKTAIREFLDQVLGDAELENPDLEELKEGAKMIQNLDADWKKMGAIIVAINKIPQDKYEEMAKKLDEGISKACDELQKEVTSNLGHIFKDNNEEENPNQIVPEERLEKLELNMEKPKDPDEKGISEDEKKQRLAYKKKYKEASLKKLTDVIADNFTAGKRGQGKFIRLVLSRYFSGVDMVDKRAMIASAVRNAKPYEKPAEDASKEEKEKVEKAVYANYLGGLLKGAGPLMQKMLQGLPLQGLPPEMTEALADMKSKLAPIPQNIVEAELRDMVVRSKNRVTKIDVKQPLGAASVGQAFLCTMYGPGFEKGKDVVIKLLRPDVRNRMMREKKIMLKCAKDTDPNGGMEKTYQGMLKRVEEELDLTIEATNADKGSVYESYSSNVKSVKVDHSIEPTTNSLVLEKAEGQTLDSYMTELKAERDKLINPFLSYKTQVKENGQEVKVLNTKEEEDGEKENVLLYNLDNMGRLPETKKQLRKMLSTLQKRQKHMIELSKIWVTEGIFKNGFYHGDMHAGNIMINDNNATVIDYGNATKLSEKQIMMVTQMILAATAGHVEQYRNGFHQLLKASGFPEEVYQQKRDELTRVFSEVLSLGDRTSAGERIMASLIRAQDLGLAIPPEIFNFSQSQFRMANAVSEMNEMIRRLQKDIKAVDIMEMEVKEGEQRADQPKVDVLAKAHYHGVSNKERFADNPSFDATEEMLGNLDIRDFTQSLLVDLDKLDAEARIGAMDAMAYKERDFVERFKVIEGSYEKLKAKFDKGLYQEEFDELITQMIVEMNEATGDMKVTHGVNFINEIRDGLMGVYRNIYEEDSRQKFDMILNTLREHPVSKRMFKCYEASEAYDKSVRDNEAKKENTEKLTALVEAVQDSQFEEQIANRELMNEVKNALRSTQAETIADVEKQLAPYFEDAEHRGPLLKKAYDEYRAAQAEMPMGVNLKAEAKLYDFVRVYYDVIKEKGGDLVKALRPKVDMSEPEDFLDAMCASIEENQSAAIRRLGGYLNLIPTYFRYRGLF